MPEIFISHAQADSRAANKLYKQLRGTNYSVWLDKQSLLPGQNWKKEIEKNISKAKYLILLISSKSVTQDGQIKEDIKVDFDITDETKDQGPFLIPVRLDNVKIRDERLKDFLWIDMLPSWKNGFNDLLRVLGQEEQPEYTKLNTVPITIAIDPGSASQELVADILSDISILYRLSGGSGINFSLLEIHTMAGSEL